MKILMVASDNSRASGAFNSMAVLSRKLIDYGNKVIIAVPRKGDGIKLLEENDIPFIKIRNFNWIISKKSNLIEKIKVFIKCCLNIVPFLKFKMLIKREKIEVVHMNTSWCYIAAKSAISNNVKLVWHIREFLEEDQSKKFLFPKYSLSLINRSNAIICISKSIFEKYSNVLNKSLLKVIYNGIDTKKYVYNNRRILSNDTIQILCVGSISEKKGSFETIESIAEVVNNYGIKAILTLIGICDKDSEEKIYKIINKYENKEFLKIIGKRDNVVDYYNKADIFIMGSISEAFGRVTIESMMCGCLVVGRNSAATSELISDKENGFLYNNNAELIEKLLFITKNKDFSRKIAEVGRKNAIEKFDSENNAVNINKLYQEI